MKTHSMTTFSKTMAGFFAAFLVLLFVNASSSKALVKSQKDEKKGDKNKIVEPYVVRRLTQGISLYSLGTLSPDKKHLAFVAARQNASPNLYIMGTEDFSITPPLTSLRWGTTEPQWSPDGSMIAIAGFGDTGNFADIYTVEIKTGSLRKLTTNNFSDKEPVFLPDGNRLLFTTDQSPLEDAAFGILHIASIAVKGGKAEYFTEDEASTIHPMVSLDGKSMFLVKVEEASGRHSLWEYDLKGKPLRDLTEDKFARIHKLILHPANNTAILWGQLQPEQQDSIYILDLKTREVKELPEPDLPKHTPALSPSGSLIAFIAPAESGNQLYLYDAKTGLIQQLTYKGSNAYTPVFLTDEKIIFGSNRDGWVQKTTQQVSANQATITEEVKNDREIYLINLTQKTEDEKKKK